MTPSKATNTHWLLVALVATVAAALVRLLFIDQGLWADEVQSVEIAQKDLPELLTRTGLLDVHPPLYYLVLKAWQWLGGESDLWVRLFSLGVGSLTVGCFVYWARQHVQGLALFFGVAFLTFSTWHTHYSLEVRSYALLTLLTLILTWQVERWLSTPAAQAPSLRPVILLTIAVGLTHYYGLFCVVGLNIFVLSHANVRGERAKHWAAGQAAALGGFAWWLPFFFVQAFDLPEGFTSHLQDGPALFDVIAGFGPATATQTTLAVIAGGMVLLLALWALRDMPFREVTSDENQARMSGLRWLLAMAVLGLLLTAASPALIPDATLDAGHPALNAYMEHGFDIASARVPWAIVLLVLCWLGLYGATRLPDGFPRHRQCSAAPFVIGAVLLIGGGLHLMQPSLSMRNLLVLLPMVALLASSGMKAFPPVAKGLSILVITCLSGVSLSQAAERFTPRADIRGAAEYILDEASDSQPQVYVVSAFDNGTLQRYLRPLPSQGIMDMRQMQGIRPSPVYVLLTREAWRDAERFREGIKRHLSWGFELSNRQPFRDVELLIFSPLDRVRESTRTRPSLGSVPLRK